MHRVDVTEQAQRWEYACPTGARHRDWRVVDGRFQCRSCDAIYQELIHLPTEERVARSDMEIVGPHADHQAAFDPREV